MSKTTLATLKSFIKHNKGKLLIDVHSHFDGMIDGLSYRKDGYSPAGETDQNTKNTLGIKGCWVVDGSRNFFQSFETDKYSGIEVSNCCGNFTLAIKK